MRSLSWTTVVLTVLASGLGVPATAGAQEQRNEWFYMPGGFNWQFLKNYPEAGRLFNAFDYGHAVLYERLYTKRGKAEPELEKEYRFLTTDLLLAPPRYAVVEEAIAPRYAKVAWRAKQAFDWAHMLHRQLYDIYADERIPMARKDSLVERATDYYLSRRKYAFAPVPKSMGLMEGQYFSQAFRRAYPKFNGLIWAYHWLQVGLYEPLLEGTTKAERKAATQATLARFWSMLEDAPARMPKGMPMTATVAPRFSERHPRAAAIFDNLHMAHDIISDVLTSDSIPHDKKAEVIYKQLDKLQDSTRDVMSWDEWRKMGEMMGGIAVMGGPATGLLPPPPTTTAQPVDMGAGGKGHDIPSTPSGESDSMSMKAMPGMNDSASAQGMAPMDHGQDTMPGMAPHPGGAAHPMGDTHMHEMMELHRRMMADPVIHERMMADTVMRRMMREMMDSMPSMNGDHQPAGGPPPAWQHAPRTRTSNPAGDSTPNAAPDSTMHHHH
jgi:hypothetical protein